jgi:hypothetical protein
MGTFFTVLVMLIVAAVVVWALWVFVVAPFWTPWHSHRS